jgi:hypothetical protein
MHSNHRAGGEVRFVTGGVKAGSSGLIDTKMGREGLHVYWLPAWGVFAILKFYNISGLCCETFYVSVGQD